VSNKKRLHSQVSSSKRIFDVNNGGCVKEEYMSEFLVKAYDSYKHVLGDYHRLISSVKLSDEDAELMNQILEQAESDEILNFLLGELNYIVGQRLGLFDNQNINAYKNQQAYLREYLDCIPSFLDKHRELQKELTKRGFYSGPIDGIFGQDSRMAVKSFQEDSNLQVSGIIDLETYRKLTHRNSTSQKPGE
jgi:Putative peptidoglycan binding domain